MKKRTIPILIGFMILALLGIIFIQYKWIEQSLDEKKRLIDHKVHQLVDNVDRRMTDYNSLAYISSVPEIDSVFHQRLLEIDQWSNSDSTTNEDSIFVTYYHDFDLNDSLSDGLVEVNEVEVRIVAAHGENNLEQIDIYGDQDSVIKLVQDINDIKLSEQLSKVNAVFERIRVEVSNDSGDKLLDSIIFHNEIIKESQSMGISPPSDWGVYDRIEDTYLINPVKDEAWDFQLPLFKNGIVDPDRYMIRLNMMDSNAAIWRQVFIMVSLSVVFIAIIIFVFIYSIRLVIRHKKISAIKSDFINNMTHEFKTPLASISLAADSILHPKTALNPNKITDYVQIIKAEKTKLNQHIETILEVASLKENDVAVELTKIDLNVCLQGALQKLDLLIQDKNCVVKMDLESDICINANAYHLENVFCNLIENSIKYSPDYPQINISTKRIGKEIEIKIQDKGIGMTKDQINKAFDHFYRAQKGNIHNTKGFGLGLSFVKYMIDKMHSTIRIESELNIGTTVIIKFHLCP